MAKSKSYKKRLPKYAPGGETDDPRKRMAAEAAKRKSSIALPDISFVQPSGKETGYLKEEEKKKKVAKREADIARVMKNPAIKSRKQAEDFLKMKAKEAYRGPDQLRETPEAQSKIGKFIDVAAHPFLALDIYRTSGVLPDYFAEKPIPGVTGIMDIPYSFTGVGTAAGIAKAGKDLPSQIMEGDWAGVGTNLLSIVPGLRNIKGITKKGLKNIVKPFRGLDDINLNLSAIESAGSNAEKIKLINKLKSQGIISENINTDKLIEYPNLLNLATKKGIQNKLTFQRAVRPFEQAVTSEGKISTLSAADEAALASKAGTSEAAKAMYMASHIPAQKYGARSGLEHLPSDLDALYLSKLKAGETPTPNLTYGPYSTKVRYPFDFSKGSAEDWYKQYSKLPFKGEQIYDPKTGTSSWKFPAAVSGKVQPGDIYDWYNVNDGYGAVIGKPGTKALEPVYTEFNPKMAELEKAQLEHDQMLDLFKANKPEDLDFYLNYMKEKYPNVDVSNVKSIQEAYPKYAKHLSEQLKLSKQEPTERMYYSPLEHGFKYGGYKYNNMAGKLNRRKGLPGNFPRYEGGSTTTSNAQGFNPLSLAGPAIGLMGAFQQPKGQMDYGTSDYFQDQNQAEGQSKAATAAIARGLSFVPGWGQAASLGLQGAQALSGLVGQKDAYGMAPTGFQQGASALLDPVGSLVSAAHGQNPFSRKEKMREVGSLYQDMSAQKTTDQQDAYTQNVKAAEGQYLEYGGYMPYYALGGRARYFNGGRMANPYAKEPNAEIENEVVNHADGGIQDFSHLPRHENATDKNLVSMEDGSFVFSNRIKNPATGNYFAKDAKPLNTSQQEKILADGNTTPLTKNSAKLMFNTKKILADRLAELHEATKTYNGAQKAENEATEEFIGMLGGMYGKGGLIKRKDGSYSPRGLWDNIRANRGSGKKPTKAMLEQERKIKAQEKAMGGYMYADGGSFNNPGFMALPEYVQDKIKGNYEYGGYTLGESYDMSEDEIKELKRQGYTFDIE